MSKGRLFRYSTSIVALYLSTLTLLAKTSPSIATAIEQLHLETAHRINAHGDEFNALAITSDQSRLIIGAERDGVLVWNITERRVERRLKQGKPVHELVALADSRFVVAAGGEHITKSAHIVRKWNIETGAFKDLQGLSGDAVSALAYSKKSGLIAAGDSAGRVAVWEADTDKLIATWDLQQVPIGLAVVGRKVYVTSVESSYLRSDDPPPENFVVVLDVNDPRSPPRKVLSFGTGRLWANMVPSPDERIIAAGRYSKGDYYSRQTALLDVSTGSLLGSIDVESLAWIGPDTLLAFKQWMPAELIHLDKNGKISVGRTYKPRRSYSDGEPFDLSGQVARSDSAVAWGVFRKGAALIEWDLKAQTAKPLIRDPVGVYAMEVLANGVSPGLLVTGGADGYARIWSLADLSLRREIKAATGLPVSIAVLDDHRAVIVYAKDKQNAEIVLTDIITGTQKKLLSDDYGHPPKVFPVGEQFLYTYGNHVVLAAFTSGATQREFIIDKPVREIAVSANRRWVTVSDSDDALFLFEINTGRQVRSSTKIIPWSPLAVTNDGRTVYAMGLEGTLQKWDTKSDKLEVTVLDKLREVHTRADAFRLSVDEGRLVIGGNHGDVGVFDAKNGQLVSYERLSSAAWYVTDVWLGGNRLIAATDTGVLLDAVLER